MTKVQENALLNLLPYSLIQDPVLVAIAEAAEIQLKEAYREAEALSNLVDTENVPEHLLDLLAYEKHVDFYDVSLPVEKKRAVVQASISLHRKKGTPLAVEKALSSIGIKNKVVEWFEYNGNPYHFIIVFGFDDETDRAARRRIKNIISPTKNTRSWLERFIYEGNFLLDREIINTFIINVHIATTSNPWAQAGAGAIGEDVRLDGEYLLNGDRFLNGFYNRDGPVHLQRIQLVMKVLHEFGVHEINLTPSLDGEFNLDGEIRLQNEPQRVRLTTLHDTYLRYKQRELIEVSARHIVPIKSTSISQTGVVPLNGQVQLDGSISLDQALFEHRGFFRVKKAGSIIEEVAI
ncbi:phage tail protein [Bacillus sp. OxB-1]|uniref:phage tail protein I n=1 Tax=Bacillus sp. (strain OxB-1) TaxID=98228 RepID=UPI000581C398|nr:phage tail protein I [Bacillus sp. OxB-1]BAQ11436.1 phage tail protein [Bacillus sp. OxB-1]